MQNPPFTPLFTQPSDVALDPTALRAGDSWEWLRIFPGYLPSDGWTLQYILNSPGARFAFPDGAVTAMPDGFTFSISVTGAQTAAVLGGQYELYAILANTSADLQQTVELQRVRVAPNLSTATAAVDTRSFAKKSLDMLEAAILGDQSPMVQEYEIHGRRVQYMSRLQLKQLRDQFKSEVRAEMIASGEYVPKRRVGIAFTGGY